MTKNRYLEGSIVTGDAKKLARTIEPGSVDLVFADPVYQDLGFYRFLAKQSLRALKPRGVCLVWASVPKAGEVQRIMQQAGLQYVYTLFYTVVAKTYRMRWYNLFCWTTPCLWFQRPGEATKPNKWIPDTFREDWVVPDELINTVISSAGATGVFEWNKNTGVLQEWISRFSNPGDLVWDPCTGHASVPISAIMTGRRFIASEIVPERAEEARRRLEAIPLTLNEAAAIAYQTGASYE